MLLHLTKQNITLQVYYAPPRVQVLPLVEYPDETRLLTTLARNEEVLLQAYVYHTAISVPAVQLRSYFSARGWVVHGEQGQAPSP